jgi:hypothetical protein
MSSEARDLKDFVNSPVMVAIREATVKFKLREREEAARKRQLARSGKCSSCGASTVRGECRLCG